MLANAQTCAVLGLDGFVVQVEVDISPGLPVFKIGGHPELHLGKSEFQGLDTEMAAKNTDRFL